MIGHLSAAGAHGCEGFVARRIDERDLIASRRRHLVGTDMLGDAASFARDDIGRTNGIEQRCLAVVDVTHDRDDGCTEFQSGIVRILCRRRNRFRHPIPNPLRRMTELLDDEFCGIRIDHIGDLMHRALLHQILDEIDGALRHTVRQFLDRDGFRDDDLARDFLAGLLNSPSPSAFPSRACASRRRANEPELRGRSL